MECEYCGCEFSRNSRRIERRSLNTRIYRNSDETVCNFLSSYMSVDKSNYVCTDCYGCISRFYNAKKQFDKSQSEFLARQKKEEYGAAPHTEPEPARKKIKFSRVSIYLSIKH